MQVYLISNLVNGKQYIGITKNTARRRFLGHLRLARSGYENPLHSAIRKYGEEYFYLEVLYNVEDRELLQLLEVECIALYDTIAPKGYNLTLGGDGFFRKHSPESLAKMRESQRAWRARQSEEHRLACNKKVGDALRGQDRSRFSAAISAMNKGKTRSEEFKRNASQKMKAYAEANREEMRRRGKLRGKKGEV